jgi:hypothetical protein
MPRTSQHPKDETFNFRVDPALKADFQAATDAEDKPAAQVLRDFMRAFVARSRHRNFVAAAHRQSAAIAARTADPTSDEATVMSELDANLAGLADEWK